MFDVRIYNPQGLSSALKQSAFAGGMCYQPNIEAAEEAAKTIPVKSALFKSGHHTTFQHSDHTVSFILDNIPVSLATFGLHFTHPFYNTSQRSGRYCTEMFRANRSEAYRQYIKDYLALLDSTDEEVCDDITKWVESGINFFNRELPGVTELAKQAILDERPNYKGNLQVQAGRIAQEQLRNVISTIAPTGMLYTVNLSTLFSMYQVAWNKPLKKLLAMMVDRVVEAAPELRSYVELLQPSHLGESSFDVPLSIGLALEDTLRTKLCNEVEVEVRNIGSIKDVIRNFMMFDFLNRDTSFNLLPFTPVSYYDNRDNARLDATLAISVATYGQYQRHRTISRTDTHITNCFYVPPLLRNSSTEEFLQKHMDQYWDLYLKYGKTITNPFVPYGAMVRFDASSDLKSWFHSISKRCCCNAQEEFWRIEQKLTINSIPDLNNRPGPPCVKGKCHEGKRYCGRDLSQPVTRTLI